MYASSTKTISYSLLGWTIFLLCCLNATGASNTAGATADPDKSQTLADVLVAGSLWNGRILWAALPGDRDARDWAFNFRVSTVDFKSKHFQGKIDMRSSIKGGRECVVSGDFTDDTLSFTSGKSGNFSISAQGKMVDEKNLSFTWTGNDGKNQPRSGTAEVKLKKKEKADK